MREAAGARAGAPEDAAAGMPLWVDAAGVPWAFHSSGAWMAVHAIESGETLWGVSGLYYGAPSLAAVRGIHSVPENYAIQGPSPDRGLVPGDRILIPGLTQPRGAPDAVPLASIVTPVSGPLITDVVPLGPQPVAADGGPVDVSGGELVPVSDTPRTVINAPTAKDDTSTAAKVGLVLAGLTGIGLTIWLLMRKPKRRNPRRAAHAA